MRINFTGILAIMLLSALGWTACAPDPSCTDIYVPYVTASFYTVNEQGTEVLQTVYVDSIWAEGADTLLYESDTTAVYGLYVNPETSETTYHFCENDSCSTITFMYKRKEYLISPECGPGFRYQNLKVRTDGFFDSVIVSKTELNLVGGVNVKIYQ